MNLSKNDGIIITEFDSSGNIINEDIGPSSFERFELHKLGK